MARCVNTLLVSNLEPRIRINILAFKYRTNLKIKILDIESQFIVIAPKIALH